jgi:hypothetical protein
VREYVLRYQQIYERIFPSMQRDIYPAVWVDADQLVAGDQVALSRIQTRRNRACVRRPWIRPRLSTRSRAATRRAQYRVVPLEGYEDGQERIYRDYRTTATIEEHQQQLYGTACRQPGGSWQRVI